MENINMLREQVDQVDREFVAILAKRAALVKKVAKYKKLHNLPPLDPSRWQEVLKARKEWGSELDLDPEFIHDIFERIHDYSLQIEGEICHK